LIINLENPSSWPPDLISYLERHLDLFLGWEHPRQGEDACVSARAFDRAIYGLHDLLVGHSLVGWHCTRLTQNEIATIGEHGMAPPDATILAARIDAIVKAGIVGDDIAGRLRAENQAHEINRAGKIWFCFFPPHIAGQSGIERFFRSWGGEALYNSHEDDAQSGPVLAGIGIPCLIEAEVPIATLPSSGGLPFKVYRRFLISRGHPLSEPVEHEDRALQPLPPKNVRRIIRFPEPDFIHLTRCDEWDVPLRNGAA
jgi:hypothetical protein